MFTVRTEVLKKKGRLDRGTCPSSLSGSLKWAVLKWAVLRQGKGGQMLGDSGADRPQGESTKASAVAGRGRMEYTEWGGMKTEVKDSSTSVRKRDKLQVR